MRQQSMRAFSRKPHTISSLYAYYNFIFQWKEMTNTDMGPGEF